MTIAPFQQFMDAVDRQIERKATDLCPHCLAPMKNPAEHDASGAGCDRIPVTEKGKLIGWMPNFKRPGVAEKVERDAFEAECAANPPTSSLGNIIRLHQINRFEERLKQKRETP